jgi:hypothetical protein
LFLVAIGASENGLEHRSGCPWNSVNASLTNDVVSAWLIAWLCTLAVVVFRLGVFVQDVV